MEKDLRVALFTGNYNYIRDGVSLTLNRLVEYLTKKDIPVLVFGPTSENPALDHQGELVPIPSMPMPVPGRQEYRVTVGFPDEAQQKLRAFSPTLVHLATPDLLGFRAMRFAQSNDIQIVASYHTHFTSYLRYYNLDLFEHLGWKYLQWFYSQCEHIYVPSVSMAEELAVKGIDHGMRIWARGVDVDHYSPEKRSAEWRDSWGFDPEDIVVTFISRLVWEKGLQTVVDSMKKVSQKNQSVKCLFVGEGPARKELQYMMRDAVFTGHLEGEELTKAYASSDVFLFPSETETFGNVTLEAMASGLPAIVADANGSRSLVESGVNGFVVPAKDTNAFANAVLRIAEDADLRHQMSLVSRQKALSYSWNQINDGLIKNYREALAKPLPELKI